MTVVLIDSDIFETGNAIELGDTVGPLSTTIGNDQHLIVTEGTTILSSLSSGISFVSNEIISQYTLTIDGSIFADDFAIRLDEDVEDTDVFYTINVGATGSLHSAFDTINIDSDSDIFGASVVSISNAGLISSDARENSSNNDNAIDIDRIHTVSISNSGTIRSNHSSTAVYVDQARTQLHIVNYGLIETTIASDLATESNGEDYAAIGIEHTGAFTGIHTIENHGTVNGANYAFFSTEDGTLINTGLMTGDIRFESGSQSLVDNSGDIFGDISFSTLSSSVRNSGTINGNVSFRILSSSIDTFDGRGGTLNGDINLFGGSDTVNLLGATVTGTVFGGTDDDIYIVDDSGINLSEALSEGIDTVKAAVDWTLGDNFENLALLGGDDLDGNGNALANILTGNAGDNSLNGEDGDDFIYGGNGGDEIRGGVGLDTIEGGNGDDHIRGQDGADDIEGGKGDDHIRGGRGDDKILGQAGDDYLRGGGGNDDIKGHSGHDTLRGGEGDDTLNGQDGNDILIGGLGQDTLEGGSGIDTFVFNAIQHSPNGSTADVILDFVSGTDLIDLSGLNGDLTFIGSDSFSATGGAEVRFVVGGSDTLIRVDLDGNGTSDMKITLDGVTSDIAVSDLVL